MIRLVRFVRRVSGHQNASLPLAHLTHRDARMRCCRSIPVQGGCFCVFSNRVAQPQPFMYLPSRKQADHNARNTHSTTRLGRRRRMAGPFVRERFLFFPPSSTSCYKACLLLESGIENRGTSGEGDTTPGNCPPQTVTDTLTTRRRRRRRAAMATATAIAKAKEPRLHCAKHPSNPPRDKEAIEAVF